MGPLATLVDHALALPFVVADVLQILQSLPADVVPGDHFRWEGCRPLHTLYEAYGCASPGPVTKKRLVYRVLNYPKDLTEVADGVCPA